jgi:protein-tyrosine-phosphatase
MKFDDPTRASGSEEEITGVFRRVRDEIRAFVETLPGALYSLERSGE